MNRAEVFEILPQGVSVSREDVAEFGRAAAAEWLVTNGLGSYAAGSVSLACTRRYHGLLVAALMPPVGRQVLVAKCEIEVAYRGRRYALGSNEYADGTVHPRGYELLESFRLDGAIPEWTWIVGDLTLRQRVWMEHGEQTSYLALEVVAASAPVHLTLTPLCTARDYHAHARAGAPFDVRVIQGGCEILAAPGACAYRVVADVAVFEPCADWHYKLHHRVEHERGLDAEEDLFVPGSFASALAAGEAVTVTCTIARTISPATLALRRERDRQRALLDTVAPATPSWIRQLVLAADQFVVQRGAGGATVIAGYPWFTDWGRDTMIALPGLTLATGRVELARQILATFAAHVSEGMLPNRFPDGAEAPEYNTSDATLWFFHAVARCLEAADDADFAARLYPVLAEIAAWHVRGTRHGIRIDSGDELLSGGEAGVQLTWMDARVGARVITPRHGKAVEINALWQRALKVLKDLAERCGETAAAADYRARAARHAESFARRFWYAEGGWLYDVVDVPGAADDASLRPNQILAIALAPELLTPSQREQVVTRCVQELWTPYGLRSLAPFEDEYRGHYSGDPDARDAVYHQGTAWSWLLGPLARAHFAVHGDAARALSLIEPIAAHLRHSGLGSISEIFDGDPPHAARGCFAQAWSVAEVLDAWFAIQGGKHAPIVKEVQS